jgi:hypothetical protein
LNHYDRKKTFISKSESAMLDIAEITAQVEDLSNPYLNNLRDIGEL